MCTYHISAIAEDNGDVQGQMNVWKKYRHTIASKTVVAKDMLEQ